MNESQWDNLLSAWVDGELSAEDRARVERRLESSAEARQELAEIEQLAAWIAGLPRDSLPAGFAAQVKDRVAAVIAADAVIEPDSESPAPRPATIPLETDRRIVWTRGVGALIATAAALFIITMSLGGPDQSEEFALNTGNAPAVGAGLSESGSTAAAEAESLADAESARGRQDFAGEGNRGAMDDATANQTSLRTLAARGLKDQSVGFRQNMRKPGQDGTPSNGASVAAIDAAAGREAGGRSGGFGKPPHIADAGGVANFGAAPADDVATLMFDADLSRAQIGQVVEAIQRRAPTAGGSRQVSVVRLTVVDRLEGLQNLQLLLAKNHIPPSPSRPAEERAGRDRPPEAPVAENLAAEAKLPGRLVAVYVEATSPQLSSVLEQINREPQFQRLEVEPQPLTLAQLELASAGERKYFADAYEMQFPAAVKSPGVPQRAATTLRAAPDEADKKQADEPKPNLPFGRGKAAGPLIAGAAEQLEAQKTVKRRTPAPTRARPGEQRDNVQELAHISRQLQLSLSEEKLNELKRPASQPTPAVALSRLNRPAASQPEAESPATNTLARRDAEQRDRFASQPKAAPLQVLFVLVADESGGKKSGASRGKKPTDSAPRVVPPAETNKKARGRKPDGAA